MKPDYLDIVYNDFAKIIKDSPYPFSPFMMPLYFESKEELSYARVNDALQNYVKHLESIRNTLTDAQYSYYSESDTPIIAVTQNVRYLTDESITQYETVCEGNKTVNDISLEKEYPVNIDFAVIVISTDPQKIVALEEYVLAKYRESRQITVTEPTAENGNIIFNICHDLSDKIARCHSQTAGINFYASKITVRSDIKIAFAEAYHPALVSFDMGLQVEVLQRINALHEIADYYEEQLPYKMTVLKDEQYQPTEEEKQIQKKSNDIRELAERLRISSEILSDRYSDPYYVKTILSIITEKKCDIQTALQQFDANISKYEAENDNIRKKKVAKVNEQVKAERKKQREIENEKIREEKKRQREILNSKKLLSRGDPVTNIFTDSVLQDMKTRVNLSSDIPMFAGTTYMDFYKAVKDGTLHYPAVVVKTNANYTFACHLYLLQNANGVFDTLDHDYVNTLPYVYGVTVRVAYTEETKEQAKEIIKAFQTAYANETNLIVLNPFVPNTHFVVKLCVNASEPVNSTHLEGNWKIKTDELTFTPYYSVYYHQEYTSDIIENNPKCQLALVQQAEFALLTFSKLRTDILKQMETHYKPLVTGTKATFSLFIPKPYKELKAKFDRHLPISKDEFYAVLTELMNLYPSLYDKMMSGWTYEQLYADIDRIAALLNDRYNNLCDQLNIPKGNVSTTYTNPDAQNSGSQAFSLAAFSSSTSSLSIDYRSLDALRFYLDNMSKRNIIVDEAIEKYKEAVIQATIEKEKQQREEEQRRQEEAERASYEEYNYGSSGSSSGGGGGFLRDVAKIATGTAIGNKLSQPKKNAKKDLMGTPQCCLGKKDEFGFTQSCASCSVLIRDNCTRWR